MITGNTSIESITVTIAYNGLTAPWNADLHKESALGCNVGLFFVRHFSSVSSSNPAENDGLYAVIWKEGTVYFLYCQFFSELSKIVKSLVDWVAKGTTRRLEGAIEATE